MEERLNPEKFFAKRRDGWWSTEGQERRKDFGVASVMVHREYTREEIIRAIMAHKGTQEREKDFEHGLYVYAKAICDDAFLNWKPEDAKPMMLSYKIYHLDRPPEEIYNINNQEVSAGGCP